MVDDPVKKKFLKNLPSEILAGVDHIEVLALIHNCVASLS